MFKKESRLTKDKEFDQVFKKGKSSYLKFIGVKTVANDLVINRYGILVSTKVSKKAVERNKIKRQIREIIKDKDLNIKQGFDIVIIVLPGALGKDFNDLKIELKKCFQRVKLI